MCKKTVKVLISPNSYICLSKEAIEMINDEKLMKKYNDYVKYCTLNDSQAEDEVGIILTSSEDFSEIKRNDLRLVNAYQKLGKGILCKKHYSKEDYERAILFLVEVPDDLEYEICEYYLSGEFIRIKKNGWYKEIHYKNKDKDILK